MTKEAANPIIGVFGLLRLSILSYRGSSRGISLLYVCVAKQDKELLHLTQNGRCSG